ncbi:MAG: phosphodiester glycosidase family protein [Chloroflexota bacterium]
MPIPQRKQLYDGVIYYRRFHLKPRLLIAHIITVDLNTPGLEFLVTPGDPNSEFPLTARTTSEFAKQFDLQVAINGDGFTPWYSNSILSYYPHPGDGVVPNGNAISQGVMYHGGSNQPTFYITASNQVSFTLPGDERTYNAISGDSMIVINKEAVPGLDDVVAAPRTAIGIDGAGSKLVIVVVDGRQFLYSQGATMSELAEILILYGADTAMNLDGGGSSTLVVESELGVKVMNSPIDRNIPGFERAVGNHLGIKIP